MKIIQLIPLSGPVHTSVEIPGSKSYTNRALFLAALSESTTKIINPLISDDTTAMINCLKELGIKILLEKNQIKVVGGLKNIKEKSYNLNAGLSGTTIRFILAMSTVIPGTKIISGEEGLNKRPIKDLVAGLTQLGAKIKYLKKMGYPPVKVSSSKLNQGTIKIKGSVSSQYISALLMIAPIVGDVTIEITDNQISKPYIDITIESMEKFGIKVINNNYKSYIIPNHQNYHADKYLIEGDLSSAGYFLAIAALAKLKITLKNINPSSKQADNMLIKILESMGNKISYGKNEVIITGTGIKPVKIDTTDCPDQIQTLAVLAAFAAGTSKISGVSSLRIKETNRIIALRKELKKMGIKTAAAKNTLTVYGGSPKAARIETYGDHRMAMAFAVAGAKLPGMEIVDPEVVNKTFPHFWKKLNSVGVKTKKAGNNKNIILIGMRGSGKTTVSKILAQKLNRKRVELDKLITRNAGLTIPEMVEKYGWDFFRDQESKAAKEVTKYNGRIISTGGGIITRSENIDSLKKNGIFVFLKTSLDSLVQRMESSLNRPPLTQQKTLRGEISEVLKQRRFFYNQSADVVINTDHLNPKQVADRIIMEAEKLNI